MKDLQSAFASPTLSCLGLLIGLGWAATGVAAPIDLTITGTLSPYVLNIRAGGAWALPELSRGATAVMARRPVAGTSSASNRWGDQLGPLFDADRRWIQQQLVLDGQQFVRATSLHGQSYMDALFAAEDEARGVGRGSWAEDWPHAIAELLDGNIGYAVVRGQVVSVRPGRFTSYITVLDESRQTLTVAVDIEAQPQLEQRHGLLDGWKGKTLLVRGLVTADKLPNSDFTRARIDVRLPDQLRITVDAGKK